jgi:hypothetical protein
VVGDQRAQEAREGDARADLQDQAGLVGALHACDEAADADPDRGEDRRQEERDHCPVVPRPRPPLPEQVVAEREDEDEDSGENPGQYLARSRRDPEGQGGGADRQVARRGFSSSSWPSTWTSGSQASQEGKYQFQRPRIFIVAGTMTERMIVASMKSATATPKPIC